MKTLDAKFVDETGAPVDVEVAEQAAAFALAFAKCVGPLIFFECQALSVSGLPPMKEQLVGWLAYVAKQVSRELVKLDDSGTAGALAGDCSEIARKLLDGPGGQTKAARVLHTTFLFDEGSGRQVGQITQLIPRSEAVKLYGLADADAGDDE